MKDDAIGQEVDGYRIEGVLGRGGMGVVYKGIDVALSRPVALKRINPGQAHREAFLHRFRAEARALARINSPNIVSIYALRETDIGLLIVMEYVDGGTVADRMTNGAMAVPEAVPFLQQILSAFEDAHNAEVIHRDIKPQNLLLTQDDVVKVTDFGIAKMRRQDSGETVTQGGQGGTLKYMSPEQISDVKAVDNRSDLYSIGMTAYQMLAGKLPFEGSDTDFDIMRKVVEGSIPSPGEMNPALPKSLVRWIIKSIQKQPADRFQDANEMREALKDALERAEQSGTLKRNEGRGDVAFDGPTVLDDATRIDDAPTVPEDAATQISLPDSSEAPDASEEATVMDLDSPTVPSAPKTPETDEDVSEDTPASPPPQPSTAGTASSAGTTGERATEDRATEDRRTAKTAASAPDADAATAEKERSESTGMPWGTVAAAVVGALLAAVAYWVLVPTGGAPTPAAISLRTTPPGAAVLVNGDTVGTTPLQSHTLAAGPVTLTVRKTGHAPFDTTFQAKAGETYRLGTARLAALPTADASAGGASPGASSPGASSPGNQSRSGSPDASSVSGASPSASESRLEGDAAGRTAPAPSGSPAGGGDGSAASSEAALATLTFDVQPSGAMYVNGSRKGISGQVQLPPGPQQVSCRHPSHGRIDTTLTVQSGATESITCHFEQEVNVTAMGGWGNIWLNGENTKRRTGTGEGAFRLEPGTHTIALPIARSGTETTGGAYRMRVGEVTVQRRSFDGSEVTIRVRPRFSEATHAVSFRVTNTGS